MLGSEAGRPAGLAVEPLLANRVVLGQDGGCEPARPTDAVRCLRRPLRAAAHSGRSLRRAPEAAKDQQDEHSSSADHSPHAGHVATTGKVESWRAGRDTLGHLSTDLGAAKAEMSLLWRGAALGPIGIQSSRPR